MSLALPSRQTSVSFKHISQSDSRNVNRVPRKLRKFIVRPRRIVSRASSVATFVCDKYLRENRQ